MSQPSLVITPRRLGRRRRRRPGTRAGVIAGVVGGSTLALLAAITVFFFTARPLIGNTPPAPPPGLPLLANPVQGSAPAAGWAAPAAQFSPDDPNSGAHGASAPTGPDRPAPAARAANKVGTVDPPVAPAATGPRPRPVTLGQAEPRLGTSLLDPRRSPPAHILLLGLDGEGDRADALLLLRADVDSGRLAALALPRDTLASIARPGSQYPTWDKVGHASAYRDSVLPRRERARQTVEGLLGARVHRYVAVNLQAFVTVVDALGGITMAVPFRMEYVDPYQNLRIDIPEGHQRLSGQQALGLVRWRQGNDGRGYGDLGRVRTQQAFLTALYDQLRQPGSLTFLLPRLPQLLGMVESDLTLAEATALANLVRKVQGKLDLYTLPGTGGNPGTREYGYFFADEDALAGVLANWSGQ